ncbi:hypothetical protein MUK42_33875 [Musa troglodytarum]|uniref:Uncharacterized protein n=1 Tax=Musa troglodytarum TaxID=320322 RepID=A0A9E7EE41_9LILI|nr:hypothetical protein MUK42_33875 [Musa troglodytarum]
MRDSPSKRFHLSMNPSIMFKEEMEHLDPNHDNAIVIYLRIINALVKRILVDTKSSIDILYYDSFLRIGLSTKNLQPISSILISFTRDSLTPLGMIYLYVTFG